MTLKNSTTRSQKAAILNYLLAGKSQLEAAEMLGCWRLGARCYDLREDGYLIETEMVTNKATGKRYARYYMPKDEIAMVKAQRSAA